MLIQHTFGVSGIVSQQSEPCVFRCVTSVTHFLLGGNHDMKKILAMCLALFMLFALVACDNSNSQATDSSSSQPTTTEGAEQVTADTSGATEPTQTPTGSTTTPPETTPPETAPSATTPPDTTPPATTPPATTPPETTPPETTPTETAPPNDYQYELELSQIETAYEDMCFQAYQTTSNNKIMREQIILTADSKKVNIRTQWQRELINLNNQKDSLYRQMDQELGQALAMSGGYWNSYATTIKNNYEARIKSVDNAIARTNQTYSNQIAEIDALLAEVPTEEELDAAYAAELLSAELWRDQKIAELNAKYGKA